MTRPAGGSSRKGRQDQVGCLVNQALGHALYVGGWHQNSNIAVPFNAEVLRVLHWFGHLCTRGGLTHGKILPNWNIQATTPGGQIKQKTESPQAYYTRIAYGIGDWQQSGRIALPGLATLYKVHLSPLACGPGIVFHTHYRQMNS